MLMSATTYSVIVIGRNMLKEDSITSIITNITSNGQSQIVFTNMILAQDRNKNLDQYFDNDELNKEFGKLYQEFVIYMMGHPEAKKPSIDNLKELVYGYCEDYEKGTGKKIDMVAINGYFETFQVQLDKLEPQETELTKVFDLLYSDTFFNLMKIIFSTCILFVYLLEKDIIKTIRRVSNITIINGVSIMLLGFAVSTLINSVIPSGISIDSIYYIAYEFFYKIAYISIGIGIALYIFILIIKLILKRNKHQLATDNNDNPLLNSTDIQENINSDLNTKNTSF